MTVYDETTRIQWIKKQIAHYQYGVRFQQDLEIMITASFFQL